MDSEIYSLENHIFSSSDGVCSDGASRVFSSLKIWGKCQRHVPAQIHWQLGLFEQFALMCVQFSLLSCAVGWVVSIYLSSSRLRSWLSYVGCSVRRCWHEGGLLCLKQRCGGFYWSKNIHLKPRTPGSYTTTPCSCLDQCHSLHLSVVFILRPIGVYVPFFPLSASLI